MDRGSPGDQSRWPWGIRCAAPLGLSAVTADAYAATGDGGVVVHRAKVADVRRIKELVDAYAGPILLEKTLANLFEDVTEFWVAEVGGVIVGCGALHVLWEDLGEIRTVATDPAFRRHGVGHAVCTEIIAQAIDLGLHRLFVLTFETEFFSSLGFEPIEELDLSREAYAELRSSYDRGVAEFLDLPYVKPNTLGNTRMLKIL
jgi:amino-acid N-acetyltransferase